MRKPSVLRPHVRALATLLLMLAFGGTWTGEARADRVVNLGHGATLTVARGVQVSMVRTPRLAALPTGERRAGRAVSLRFRGGRSDFLGRLRFRLPRYSRKLDAPDLRRLYRLRVWQGPSRRWRTVRSRVSVNKRHLIADVRRRPQGRKARASLAPWNYISGGPAIYLRTEQLKQIADWIVEDLIKLRSSERPECADRGAPPAWAQATGLTQDLTNPLLGCLRGEGDVVVAELVNNRPFGVVMRYGRGVEFGWADGGFGLPKLYSLISQWASDGLYIPSQARASVGVKPFDGSATFRTGPTRLSILLDLIVDVADVGTDKALEATSDTRCKGALAKLLYEDPTEGIEDLVTGAATQAVDCLPAVAAVILKNIESTGSTRAQRWKFIRHVAQRFSLAGLAAPLASRWGGMLADKLTGGELASFTIEGSSRGATSTPSPPNPTPKPPLPTPLPTPPSPPTPPSAPKPYAGNLRVVVYGGGHVGVAFDVGWQTGRDPVTCHFFRDNVEVFTAQCGTYSSKQFYGVPAGTHSWHATVSDRFGVYSDPTNVVVRDSN